MLDRLGTALRDAGSRKRFLHRITRIIRRVLIALTICYVGLLLLLPVLAAWIGERNVTLAFLLYMPRVIALLPLPFLLAPTLLFSRRMALVQIAAGLLFLTFGMGFEWRRDTSRKFAAPPAPSELTALTWNRGQHANQSLQPFKNLTKPDLIALQETSGRSKRYLADPNYSEFGHGMDVGEHALLSRHPILSGNLVQLGTDLQDNTPAARFVIDFQGKEVVVYSVHFITARDTLLHYRRGAFLYGILGIVPGTGFHSKMKDYQAYWLERIRTAEALKREIEGESLPTLVLGDFNAPSGGYIHRLMSDGLRDSHQAAGSGCGYSFPGATRNPLSLGGPWMRIDYILASDQWEVLASLAEDGRPSQHRAVAARFRLK
ncbi:endonuclease/exonuclease/phosphatase family protein [Akkermansiaceae bacterium]|nr:endonuclease/exonuclease/phosphatase family protein [Akkermansiaceae bacterium]